LDDRTGKIVEITYKTDSYAYSADYLTEKMEALIGTYTSSFNMDFTSDATAYNDENSYTKIYYKLESKDTSYGNLSLKCALATYGFGVRTLEYRAED
nr:hypothetical protein [Lachnospiraceae bacterium]